jgi:Tfp pilus assembly protein, tip-associated adhesin PilY1
LVYVADLEGKITKINLSDQGTMYSQTTLFNAQSNTSNGRMLFHKPDATIKDSTLWMYFGSGNIQKLQDQNSNIKNRLYGIKDKHFPNFLPINNPGTIANCKTGNNCPTNNDLGWYIDLDKSKKVTAEPTVDKDLVYFPVYEPKSLSNACETGDAILYSANTTCGKATQTKLGKGALTKVVVQDGNLVVGISGEVEKGLQSKDNLISLKSTQKAQQNLTIEGWKENF